MLETQNLLTRCIQLILYVSLTRVLKADDPSSDCCFPEAGNKCFDGTTSTPMCCGYGPCSFMCCGCDRGCRSRNLPTNCNEELEVKSRICHRNNVADCHGSGVVAPGSYPQPYSKADRGILIDFSENLATVTGTRLEPAGSAYVVYSYNIQGNWQQLQQNSSKHPSVRIPGGYITTRYIFIWSDAGQNLSVKAYGCLEKPWLDNLYWKAKGEKKIEKHLGWPKFIFVSVILCLAPCIIACVASCVCKCCKHCKRKNTRNCLPEVELALIKPSTPVCSQPSRAELE